MNPKSDKKAMPVHTIPKYIPFLVTLEMSFNVLSCVSVLDFVV